MDKFYIIANQDKDVDFLVSREIKKYLEEHGKRCLFHSDSKKEEGDTYRYTNPELVPADTECVLVLGGDGTLIQAARDLSHMAIPLLGVNFGTLGYLAGVEKQNIFPALTMLMEDCYEVEKRMMLKGMVFEGNKIIKSGVALNDIVISRSGSLRVIDFKIYVNGEFLNLYSADGIIVASPTGSTAYNMSAGGPIVSPAADMLVVTPICPHTLNTRSIILSAKDRITVELCPDRSGTEQARMVSFDGDNPAMIMAPDRVEICRADRYTKIIKLNKVSFLEILRKKMSTEG